MKNVTYPSIFGWGTSTHSGEINLFLDTDFVSNVSDGYDFNSNDVSVFMLCDVKLAAFETVTNDKFKHNTIKHNLVKFDAALLVNVMAIFDFSKIIFTRHTISYLVSFLAFCSFNTCFKCIVFVGSNILQ